MVIGLIGENCVGKSTLAERIQSALGGEVLAGRDYLRLARSESEAAQRFRRRLAQALHGETVIYLISEPEQVGFLPEGAVRVLVQADLDTIQERFRRRMHGTLPAPVAAMLEQKHGMFDGGRYDFVFDGVSGDAEALCHALRQREGREGIV